MRAKRDQNDVAVSMGVSSADSITPVMLNVDPVTGYLLVDSTGDSLTPTSALQNDIDQNDVKTRYGISSVDNETLIPIRTDSQGRLLIESA